MRPPQLSARERAVLLAIHRGEAVEPRDAPEVLPRLAELGIVRVRRLDANEFSFHQPGPGHAGLTRFGREVARALEEGRES